MLIDIFNKILVLLFILSSLNVIRHFYFVIQASLISMKYQISNKASFLLGLSLAYIIMSLFMGITI